MTDFKIGDKVRYIGDYGCNAKVIETNCADKNTINVKWDYFADKISVDPNEIELVDNEADKALAKNIQHDVDEAKCAFEKAFAILYKIRDSDLLHSDLIDTSDLESCIEDNGWSSSSLWC
jgi:hypothetical protein